MRLWRSTTSPPGDARTSAELIDEPGFTFIEHDVSTGLNLDRLGDGAGGVDAVLHFASPASPPAYLARPLETLAVGSEGTRHALELARAHGARFLLASTSEIYGDPLVHPQTEDYLGNVNSVGPRSVYDEAKRFAEAITMAYHREFGLDTKIVRIFNTYGPCMAPGRRASRHQLPRAGARRRAAHHLRRRQSNPLVLLGRRRGPRLPRAARVRLGRAR